MEGEGMCRRPVPLARAATVARRGTHPYVRSKKHRRLGASRWVTAICSAPLLPSPGGPHGAASAGTCGNLPVFQQFRWTTCLPLGPLVAQKMAAVGPARRSDPTGASPPPIVGSEVVRIPSVKDFACKGHSQHCQDHGQGGIARTGRLPRLAHLQQEGSVSRPLGWTVEPSFRRPHPCRTRLPARAAAPPAAVLPPPPPTGDAAAAVAFVLRPPPVPPVAGTSAPAPCARAPQGGRRGSCHHRPRARALAATARRRRRRASADVTCDGGWRQREGGSGSRRRPSVGTGVRGPAAAARLIAPPAHGASAPARADRARPPRRAYGCVSLDICVRLA